MELLKTEIKGLDKVLGGGLPKGHTILLAGPIGSYAELFSLEFVYRGALRGEKTIYVSFEKNADDLIEIGEPFGWKIQEQIKAKNILVMATELFNYEQFLSSLEDEIFSYKATRVVIDSVSFLDGFFDNKFKFRTSIGELRKTLNKHDCTTILLSEAHGNQLSPSGVEEFLADGIIQLETIKKHGQTIHGLTIPEISGITVNSQLYPLELTKTGLRIRPIPLVL